MIKKLITYFVFLLLSFAINSFQVFIKSDFLMEFLKSNLIMILLTLLAINAAIIGIVLSKIRDIIDKSQNKDAFSKTKKEIFYSFVEQIICISLSTTILICKSATIFASLGLLITTFDVTLIFLFAYSVYILFDTVKSVFLILDVD